MPNAYLKELEAQGYKVTFKHQTFALEKFSYPEIRIMVSKGIHHSECVFDSDILLDEDYLKCAIRGLVRMVDKQEATYEGR